MNEVLTLQEVADYLRLDRCTIYKMIKRDNLPASSIPTMNGRNEKPNFRVLRSLLDHWLDTKQPRPDYSEKPHIIRKVNK